MITQKENFSTFKKMTFIMFYKTLSTFLLFKAMLKQSPCYKQLLLLQINYL